jgi:hypothetical protein
MLVRTAARVLALFAPFVLSAVLPAQTQAPVTPPQTAREALVEMVTGGEKGLMKHLTAEVQELLNKPENKPSANMLMTFSGMQAQAGAGMQTFPTGSALLTINEPTQHTKFEVHVDNDDLNGDQDTLQLSLHSLQDGQEKQDEFGYMSSRITVVMKKQQNVWRLSNIGVGMEFPLGDAEFLKKMFSMGHEGKATGVGVVMPTPHTEFVLKPEKPAAFDPSGTVSMLGFAERTFASQHPEVGFTCSLSDLTEAGKSFGLDSQLASGSYMGYKWSVSGCEGKPAGSFQIIAEPIAQGRGAKAACVDATANLRVMDDGRGSACLALGKVNSDGDVDGGGMVGVSVGAHTYPDNTAPEKPKP